VVVFCCFRDTLEKLAEALPLTTARIWGEQSREERDAAVARFQNGEVSCLLATQQAGGVGISLHDLSGLRPRRSFFTPGYSAAHMVQSLGRVWRAGGGKVIQQIVLAAGTVEERVYHTVQRKLKCIDALRDGDLV
jgi:superfamily II DNA or RNA helicase